MPIFTGPLTKERTALIAGLRSHEAFVLRRCRMVFAGTNDKRIAQTGEGL
jgi:hypothetical protein